MPPHGPELCALESGASCCFWRCKVMAYSIQLARPQLLGAPACPLPCGLRFFALALPEGGCSHDFSSPGKAFRLPEPIPGKQPGHGLPCRKAIPGVARQVTHFACQNRYLAGSQVMDRLAENQYLEWLARESISPARTDTWQAARS